jgi:hypothetical protein
MTDTKARTAAGDEVHTVFTIASWDEKPHHEEGGVKLTRARFEKEYRGDIAGRSVTESLMVYRPDGTASFAGHERFEGTVRGAKGTFVLQFEGEYRDNVAKSRAVIIEGAGTGELAGLKGEVNGAAGPEKEHPLVFHFRR